MRLNLQYFLSITFYMFFISSCTNKNSQENKRTETWMSDSTKVASNDAILIHTNGDFESKLALSTKSINYDSLYEFDSFYQLRKGKYKKGNIVKIDEIYYTFSDNLLLRDTIKQHSGLNVEKPLKLTTSDRSKLTTKNAGEDFRKMLAKVI